MGWCSGSEIYEAVAEAFEPIYKLHQKNLSATQGTWENAFRSVAEELQSHDWDCESDAYESLDVGPAKSGLAFAMGLNPDCKGVCFEIHCAGEDFCGCGCHYG